MDDSTKGRGRPKGGKPALSVVPQAEVVHLAKGQGRNAYGLTSKQEAFCQGVGARGETLAVAYRSAYDAENMSPHTVHNEACKLMGRPDIAARVNALVQAKQAKSSHDASRMRSFVIERLHSEAADTSNPPSVRVRALELIGKLDVVAVFSAKPQTDEAAAPTQELAATLEARLKALMDKAS